MTTHSSQAAAFSIGSVLPMRDRIYAEAVLDTRQEDQGGQGDQDDQGGGDGPIKMPRSGPDSDLMDAIMGLPDGSVVRMTTIYDAYLSGEMAERTVLVRCDSALGNPNGAVVCGSEECAVPEEPRSGLYVVGQGHDCVRCVAQATDGTSSAHDVVDTLQDMLDEGDGSVEGLRRPLSMIEVRGAPVFDPSENIVTVGRAMAVLGTDGRLYEAEMAPVVKRWDPPAEDGPVGPVGPVVPVDMLEFDTESSPGEAVLVGVSEDYAGIDEEYDIVVPKTYGGLPVTGIGGSRGFVFVRTVSSESVVAIEADTFNNCHHLTSVSLPNATSIGIRAFYHCSALRSVSFPKVTDIGEWAFVGSALESASFPAAVNIEERALSQTSLRSVSLPEATFVGEYAFIGCDSLTSVSLPLAESIGEGAFQDCGALAHVSIPSARSIDVYAFRICDGIEDIEIGPLDGSFYSDAFMDWKFYDTDGTTVLYKTAANLAGSKFVGSASALVKQAGPAPDPSPKKLFDISARRSEGASRWRSL